jgi:FAD/FMN-containing dehydrogenase
MVAQLQQEWREARIASPVTVAGKRADPLWTRLTEFAWAGGGDCLAVRIHVLPSAIAGLVRRLRDIEPRISIQAHAASGVVFARTPAEAGQAAPMVDGRLRPAVDSAGGQMVVLAHPPRAQLSRETLFGSAPEGWAVMKSIRKQFDPKGILNRGRFLVEND